MIGPLQLVVIGFDEDKYARDIILELKNLRKAKTIRLFDLLYIFKHQDGTITSREVSDLQDEEQREFGTLVRTLLGLSTQDVEHMDAEAVANSLGSAEAEFGLSDPEIQGVADQIPNGSAAIVVIFEHFWARGWKEAMLKNGGTVRAQGMINPDTLKVATNELATVLAAVNKAEQSSLEKMAGVMADAKGQEEEAVLLAAAAVAQAEAREQAAAEALAQAEQRETEAAEAVAAAQAREAAALQHAEEVKAEVAGMEDKAFADVEVVRQAAQRQEEKAIAHAADVEKRAQEIEASAVLRAVNAMVAAKVIEKQAAKEAVSAVIRAEVLEAAAAREAASALMADL